ncbi:MAG: BON domain-containing protein [Isosphaeraceae bacterium]|nr:BON domain-containing protein [Isosphaeraceae bacterium]
MPMLVGLKRISTAFGLLAATAAASQAQTPAPSFNQSTADAVAQSLRGSRSLAGYRIEIETRSGLVTLTGSVATQAQKAEAIARARRVSGVSGIVDQLSVTGDNRVRAAQYQTAMGFHGGGNVIYDGTPVAGAAAGAAPAAPAYDGPLPEGPAGMPGATQASNPRMPNYAWPSYAPYPNYSAVGYPTAYPWQAWPNISPPYPYPEVPLDWRAVTLRWDDGIWWLDFKKNYTRPFFTPYPFGIFAY